MDKFNIILSPKAVKDIDSFTDNLCSKISEAMHVLRENPFPRGKLIKKLKGTKRDFYRLRVDKYRVFYMLKGHDVVVLRVLGKKDAFKFIKGLS